MFGSLQLIMDAPYSATWSITQAGGNYFELTPYWENIGITNIYSIYNYFELDSDGDVTVSYNETDSGTFFTLDEHGDIAIIDPALSINPYVEYSSGHILNNIFYGTYIIRFSEVINYTKPPSILVVINSPNLVVIQNISYGGMLTDYWPYKAHSYMATFREGL